MKFSKYMGSIPQNSVHTSCAITPIHITKTHPKTDANAFFNWDNGLFLIILPKSNIMEKVDINNNINSTFIRVILYAF